MSRKTMLVNAMMGLLNSASLAECLSALGAADRKRRMQQRKARMLQRAWKRWPMVASANQ